MRDNLGWSGLTDSLTSATHSRVSFAVMSFLGAVKRWTTFTLGCTKAELGMNRAVSNGAHKEGPILRDSTSAVRPRTMVHDGGTE
jgi:hypothetical protein